MRLFVLARHGESVLNAERRINGDPTVSVPLTDTGEAQARSLGLQLAHVPLGLCVHTRFGRTRQTAELVLAARDVPCHEEPLLDDIDIGCLEGESIDAYEDWKRRHTRHDRFPNGESLDEAAVRLAHGLEVLLGRPEHLILALTHEIPIRYALNAAGGSSDLDGPAHDIANCVPYLFDEQALSLAIARMHELSA